MSKKPKTKAGTEASGIVALTVAVTFAMNGAYIPAGIAGLIGILLLIAYEYLGYTELDLTRDEVREVSAEAGGRIEDELEQYKKE